MRPHHLSVVALAALLAAGCDGGRGIPDGGSSSSAASRPTPRSIEVETPVHSPTPRALPTVVPPSGVTVLAGPAYGEGPGDVATLRVPARFAVVVSCVGTGRFVVIVEGRGRLPTRCGPHSEHFLYQPLGEPGQVTVRVDTTTSVRWAILVTTSTR